MTFSLKPIAQQVVLIIGASSGMGRSSAKLFARRGAKVMVAARGEEGLSSLVDEIRTEGGEAEWAGVDVSDRAAVDRLFAATLDRFGRIDTVVNTAGIWATSPFPQLTPDEFDRIIDVNLIGQANVLRAALPAFERNIARGQPGGALIAFASVLGRIGHPMVSAYCSSKWGVIGLIDSVRIELIQQRKPISLTTIQPFGTNTPIYETGLTRIGEAPRPAPTIINPEVVAEAVLAAAETPIRHVHGSGQAAAIAQLYQMIPDVMDELLAEMLTVERQRSGKVVAADAPNNLFSIVPDWREHGMFDAESADRSAFVDLQIGRAIEDGLSDVEPTLDGLLGSPAAKTSGIDINAVRSLAMHLLDIQARAPFAQAAVATAAQ